MKALGLWLSALCLRLNSAQSDLPLRGKNGIKQDNRCGDAELQTAFLHKETSLAVPAAS